MPNAYTEDQLVEQPAIGLFAVLGWQTVSAMEETFGARRHARPRYQGRGGAGGSRCAPRSGASTPHCRPRRSTPPSTS